EGPVPAFFGRLRPEARDSLQELRIKRAVRGRLPEIDELQLGHIPGLGAVELKRLIPKLHLIKLRFFNVALEPERLKDRDGFVLTLYPHPVDFSTYEAGDPRLCALSNYDISPILLCDAFQP